MRETIDTKEKWNVPSPIFFGIIRHCERCPVISVAWNLIRYILYCKMPKDSWSLNSENEKGAWAYSEEDQVTTQQDNMHQLLAYE